MTAEAAPTVPGPVQVAPAARRRRFARWRPSVALASVVAALVGSQIVALAILFAAGGDDAPDWLAPRRSSSPTRPADRHRPGRAQGRSQPRAGDVRHPPHGFWPAVGWMVLTYFAVMVFNVFWLLVVGTGSAPRSDDPDAGPISVGRGDPGGLRRGRGRADRRGDHLPRLPVPGADALEGPVGGALACGAVFGLAHCAVYPPQLLPLMAVFGFTACLLFWFTGSLLPCVALHAMNNALVTGRDLGWSWEIPLFMLGCMAVAVLLLLPFARERAPIIPRRTQWPHNRHHRFTARPPRGAGHRPQHARGPQGRPRDGGADRRHHRHPDRAPDPARRPHPRHRRHRARRGRQARHRRARLRQRRHGPRRASSVGIVAIVVAVASWIIAAAIMAS